MKAIRTFLIGSRAFFSGMEGYAPHDWDELQIMDTFNLKCNVLNVKIKDKDVFFFRNMPKEVFIKDTLECEVPMRVGKFLVPEFAEYIGLTIEDLKRLKPLIDKIDEKHEYYHTIYDSYIENNGFYLTKKQLNKAFELYKSKRI